MRMKKALCMEDKGTGGSALGSGTEFTKIKDNDKKYNWLEGSFLTPLDPLSWQIQKIKYDHCQWYPGVRHEERSRRSSSRIMFFSWEALLLVFSGYSVLKVTRFHFAGTF